MLAIVLRRRTASCASDSAAVGRRGARAARYDRSRRARARVRGALAGRARSRGYGLGAFTLLQRVAAGAAWRDEAQGLFGGNGAIVVGIVASATGIAGIPVLWREATEPLPPPFATIGGAPVER